MIRRRHRTVSVLGALSTFGLLAALAVPGIAVAGPVPGIPVTTTVPLLRVTMSNGVTAPKPGDTIAYAITVADRDTVALPMVVRLTAPTNLDTIVVGDGGDLVGREVSWPASLAPGQAVTVHFSAKVGDTTLRLATTACAYLNGDARPTACASDLDRVALPADGVSWGSIAGSAALVLLVLAAIAVLRRRHPSRRVAIAAEVPATTPADVARV